MERAIFWDMDGTINSCGIYYEAVMRKFVEYKALRTGLSSDFIRNVVQQIDLVATGMPDAFRRDRYPRSFKAASVAADVLANRPVQHHEADEAYSIADQVFDAPYEMYPGVGSALAGFRDMGWKQILVTKGDEGVQRSKIAKNRLHEYFPSDHIYIVMRKDRRVLEQIVRDHDVHIRESWMIGDSLKDDILPAKEIGLNTIQVVVGEHTWVYDNADAQPDHVVPNADPTWLTPIIPSCAAHV